MEVKPLRQGSVPAGYKQTEVGVIPEDWEVKPIRSVCKLINGRGFKPYEWKTTGLPIIRIQNLNGSEEFNYFGGIYAKKLEVGPGQLLFAWSGSRGTSFGPHVWKGPFGLLNYHTWKVQVHEPVVEKDFLFHELRQLTAYIEGWAHGAAALVHVQKWQMEGFEIPLPPTKAEQEAIAEALSDADTLIESLEQLLTKKRQIKQGAMQELLTGKNRLPGFTGEWEPIALRQMGNCHRGVSYNPITDLSPFDTASTVRLLRSNNVQEEKIELVGMQYVDSERVSDNQRLRASDILICMANGSRDLVGKTGRFTAADGFDYTFGAFMGCFRPNDQSADPDFVFYLFQTEQYRAHIAILLAGSSINNITPGSVEAFVIRVPLDRTEQTAIATILSDMDAEIAALEAKLAKARLLKQGMMQELLTGRIRLVEPKQDASAKKC